MPISGALWETNSAFPLSAGQKLLSPAGFFGWAVGCRALTHQLHQQRAGGVGTGRHVEEALGAPIGDAVAIDVEPGRGDAHRPRAVVDTELGGAARQARITLQVELAGGAVAAVAGDAAAVEDRLDAGRVIVAGRSRLRIGASNDAAEGQDRRRKQAIHAQARHDTTYGLTHA